MAPENAEMHSDPLALGDTTEPVPESSPLRVSLNTQLESGIPPARPRHDSSSAALFGVELGPELGLRQIDAALGDALRTEANLGLLMRSLNHLGAGAEAARTANTELIGELDELRAHLNRSREEEHALRFRMGQLEQMLNLIQHESRREREFLIDQQDRFLFDILEDHERQLKFLRQSEPEPEPQQGRDHPPAISELIAQRDQAREYATRCERERDLAWQELAASVATPKQSRVPAVEQLQRSPSAATAIGSINLRTVPVPASQGPDERPSARSTTGYSLKSEDISE